MDAFMASRTSMVGVILVILAMLVIMVVRQMVAAANLDGAEALFPMVAAAKFVTAMAANIADSSTARLS